MIYERAIDDIILLNSVAATNVRALVAENLLQFSETALSNMKVMAVGHTLLMNQGGSLENRVKVESIEHELVFTQVAHHRVHVLDAFNGLILWHSAERQYPMLDDSVLVFTHYATVEKAKGVFDTLVLTDSADVIKTLNLSIESPLALTQIVNKTIGGCNPLGTVIVRADEVTFTLDGDTFDFRNPILGDVKSIEYTRIARETTGGDKIVYRSDEWSIVSKLVLNFDVCNPQPLKDFIGTSLGRFFTYKDHEDVEWTALIVNPETAITQTGRYTYNINLEMEI